MSSLVLHGEELLQAVLEVWIGVFAELLQADFEHTSLCAFCSYTRVKAHLMKLTNKGISVCKKVTNRNLVEMQNAIDEAKLKSLNAQPKKVPLPSCVSLGAMSHSQGEAKRRRSSDDASGSGTMSGGAIGLPFYLARNPYFVSAFSYDATHNIPGVVPPGEDDVGKVRFVKDKVLSDVWWDFIDYILKFTGPIYDMIRTCDTDTPCLHLVYDMWDSMIEQVKAERTKVNSEFSQFSMNDGPFRDVDSIRDRGTMNPHTWNWSTYFFVHSVRRNKMTTKRAEDLIFIHSKLRLLSRRTPQYAQGDNKMWDIAGDNFDSLDDVGVLEIANLSLDEPEMEAVLFNDVGDEEKDNIDDKV
ncbi:hypothetical protein Acr_02g0009990 [Actinidia rufa]|uniref:Uncharacterized protein n=1 Tax=Actinidia rufa TaxID=165716 RepID=A0A7J0EA08_9ERIC|nr:hypothetical protein Acr_02g0009990 [Actinidia rufa]